MAGAKNKTQFVCQGCGYSSPKWLGRCSGCGEWNTLVEEVPSLSSSAPEGGLAAMREEFRSGLKEEKSSAWVSLGDENSSESSESGRPDDLRYSTQIQELDRVLGGGLVPDSFILLGGDPGIGKSTLLLQVAGGLAQSQLKILYVSGEESVDQVRSRARRLGVGASENIFLAAETRLERVFQTVKELKPDVLVVDSLQTFSTDAVQSAPGSVVQLREVAARLMMLAKSAGVAVWLVGHVTKDGAIAGPKVVEHMVDTVLYFEGDEGLSFRMLRAVKNRFGSARELGVFEMSEDGLQEVSNPSSLFLNDRKESVPGISIATSMEGSRPILVELQALVSQSHIAMPRRTSVGMDHNRISLLSAIIERHMGVVLSDQDLYFNVAGGLRLSEPACDLGAAAAIWSSFRGVALSSQWVWVGELGLTGEVRRVSQPETRIEEAKKLGYERVILADRLKKKIGKISGIELVGLNHIKDLPDLLDH